MEWQQRDLCIKPRLVDEVDLKMLQLCMIERSLCMKERVYQIFKECFPNIPLTEEILYLLMDYDLCTIIGKYSDNKLIGFSAVNDNRIVLMCVVPSYQRKGYGSQLVGESESLIQKNGYDTVILGGEDSKLFMGAVCEETQWNEKHNYFFEKCGYSAINGCIEMELQLNDFNLDNLNIDLRPRGITFEYWNNVDKTNLLSAVNEVEEDWVKYFENDGNVFAAIENGKCVGFTILSFDDLTICNNGHNKVGMVGCVGVIPSKRKSGIGLAMVAHATNELKKKGCDISYIHYTYLDKWYGKLGYQTIMWYWFGKKDIENSVPY